MGHDRTDGRGRTASRSGVDAREPTRRRVLAGAGTALASALAGCGMFSGDDPPDDPEYTRLQRTAIYVDASVDLSVPDDLPSVTATNNADLVVLPGDTGVSAEQAVDWLAADRAIALLGDRAERTWLAWTRSDAYNDAFDGRGSSDAEPDPQLLIAAAVGLHVPTYRHTWGNGPSDRDILQALDEALADIESRTPR